MRYEYTIGYNLNADSITPGPGKQLALQDFTLHFPAGHVRLINNDLLRKTGRRSDS